MEYILLTEESYKIQRKNICWLRLLFTGQTPVTNSLSEIMTIIISYYNFKYYRVLFQKHIFDTPSINKYCQLRLNELINQLL